MATRDKFENQLIESLKNHGRFKGGDDDEVTIVFDYGAITDELLASLPSAQPSDVVEKLHAQLEKEELPYSTSQGYGDETYEIETLVSLPDLLGFTNEDYAKLLAALTTQQAQSGDVAQHQKWTIEYAIRKMTRGAWSYPDIAERVHEVMNTWPRFAICLYCRGDGHEGQEGCNRCDGTGLAPFTANKKTNA